MRLNQFIAHATGQSRRAADSIIEAGGVKVDGKAAHLGQIIDQNNVVTLNNKVLLLPQTHTILLHKPVGYVCSRDGQGSKTIYQLLPKELHSLKPAGRLDKDSSGLLLLTNDGALANKLTHPRYTKEKKYEVQLDKPLQKEHRAIIEGAGVMLGDGNSRLALTPLSQQNHWRVTMREGRNRQIRRTFAKLGYTVTTLHRTVFGEYALADLPKGTYKNIEP